MYVAKSKIAGGGLFAATDMAAGTIIGNGYGGKVVTQSDMEATCFVSGYVQRVGGPLWRVEYDTEKEADKAWTEARDEVGGADTPMGDVVVAIATTFGDRERVEFELGDLWKATEEIYEDAGTRSRSG